MNVDRDSINRILALDDASFKTLAQSIAAAAGADGRRVERALGDIPALKKQIAGLSPGDAEKILKAVGPEKSEAIAEILRRRGVDLG